MKDKDDTMQTIRDKLQAYVADYKTGLNQV